MEKKNRGNLISANLPDSLWVLVAEYCATTGLKKADVVKLAICKLFAVDTKTST
jgi:hypothetical protein